MATIRSSPFRVSLPFAELSTSCVSAAKPTSIGRFAFACTFVDAVISTSGVRTRVSECGPSVFFSFWVSTVCGFQSLTAALAMKTSACSTRFITAASISSAVVTRITSKGTGPGSPTGPRTTVTVAPRAWAACATARPIFPVEGFEMNRTGSIASRVGPAVISTRFPLSGPSQKSPFTPSIKSASSARRPGPTSPSASGPEAGPMKCVCGVARSTARLRAVAGCSHIAVFIAGASSTGPRKARSDVVTASFAIPSVMRARRSAVAGSTT